ncbi:MAG: hypothetical protein JXL80_14670 [Planctomycetes bacterium]|nr:hypothetical protein [Planctomycetota bacterium]
MSETSSPSFDVEALAAKSERELIVAVHEGDSDASLALIDRLTPVLFNLVLRATGLMGLAEELTRDVLAAQIRGLDDRVPPSGRRWVVPLAAEVYRRLLAMDVRPDRATHRLRIPPRFWQAERLELSGDSDLRVRRGAQKLRQRLWAAWSRLTMRQRFVLSLVELHRFSTDELAETFGEAEPVARRIRDDAKLALMIELTRRASDRSGRRARGSSAEERP